MTFRQNIGPAKTGPAGLLAPALVRMLQTKSMCQDVHNILCNMQNSLRFTALFSNTLVFCQVLRVPHLFVLHLTKA